MKPYQRFLKASEVKDKISSYDFYLNEQNIPQFGHKSGQWAIAGLCPFHEDKNPGSFKVNLVSGAFRCFSCNENGGDIIAFTQKKYNISFKETMDQLVNDWGI